MYLYLYYTVAYSAACVFVCSLALTFAVSLNSKSYRGHYWPVLILNICSLIPHILCMEKGKKQWEVFTASIIYNDKLHIFQMVCSAQGGIQGHIFKNVSDKLVFVKDLLSILRTISAGGCCFLGGRKN